MVRGLVVERHDRHDRVAAEGAERWGRHQVLGAFLWSLLTAVAYALLLGSLGLFAILALLMWFTRRVDWWRPVGAGVC